MDEIGASFSDTLVYSGSYGGLKIQYDIQNDTTRHLIDSAKWYEISGIYQAKGGEQWMTLGNFGDSSYSPPYMYHGPPGDDWSYIYLDDVSVTPAHTSTIYHNITGCPGFRATLTCSQPVGPYKWSSGANTRSISINRLGIYSCSVDSNCEVANEVFNVEAIKPPLLHDTAICINTPAPQLVLNDTSLVWYQSASSVVGSASQPLVNTDMPGKMTLYAARKTGACVSEKIPINITIIDKPAAHGTAMALRCEDGLDTTIEIGAGAMPNTSYTWRNGEDGCCIDATMDGLFIRAASNRCGTTEDTVYVRPVPCARCAVFPDAFAPNVDGHNDGFSALIRCPVRDFHLRIYNRWGQTVYESDNKDAHWDGSQNGSSAPLGTYLYFASFTHVITWKKMSVKGEVSLIR